MPANRTLLIKSLIALTAVIAMLAFTLPASAAWRAGRGSDATGMAYLAVVNDSQTGERIELNCTPSGQAFLAVSWNASQQPANTDGLTIRFSVDGSHRFAAAARFRTLDRGWGAAELQSADLIAPLTAAMAIASRDLEIQVMEAGRAVIQSIFDMDKASESVGFYRSYCRL